MNDTIHFTMPIDYDAYHKRIRPILESLSEDGDYLPCVWPARNTLEGILFTTQHIRPWRPDISPKHRHDRPQPPVTKIIFGRYPFGPGKPKGIDAVQGTLTMPCDKEGTYAQIPGGNITFREDRKHGYAVDVQIELGKVLNRHNAALLSPRACAYALNVYLAFLNYNFHGVCDVSRIRATRLDIYYQWKVDGLRNLFPRFEHHVAREGSSPNIQPNTGSVGVQYNKEVYIKFYDKSRQMETRSEHLWDDELLSPPEGFEWTLVEERMRLGMALTDEEKAQTKCIKKYQKDVGGPYVYDIPEMKDVLRYEVSLQGNTLQNSGIFDPQYVGDWDALDKVFDGERIVNTLRKYFKGYHLGPATNVTELLLEGSIHAVRSIAFHDHPEQRQLIWEAKKCGDDYSKAREYFANVDKFPVISYPETYLAVPDFDTMMTKFRDAGMVWWLERVTPDGEYLRWQEEGGLEPYVPTERYQKAGDVRKPRQTLNPANMPFLVPPVDLGDGEQV